MVIYDICEMVSGKPIVFNDHLVVNNTVVEHNLAVHQIFELGFAFRNFHSNNERLALGLLFSNLLRVVTVCAKSIVHCLRVLLASNLNSHLRQSFCSAKARVGVSILKMIKLSKPTSSKVLAYLSYILRR